MVICRECIDGIHVLIFHLVFNKSIYIYIQNDCWKPAGNNVHHSTITTLEL